MQLGFIVFIGIILRSIGINKPEGLWNDEYVSWMIASTPFSDGFIQAMKSQCHMPLYYLYLKACMFWGGQSDLFLRITSLIPSVLSIIVMYFVGLQKSKKTAIFASVITAISSFLIYYSQEVRLYSILFLFSALSLLYLLKFLKNKTVTNLGGLILFDFLILFTHTIGFVFVFFQVVALSILIFKEYKKQIAVLWSSIILLGAILLPNVLNILGARTFSQWWGHFSLSKIVFLFTDYFSPVLTNLVNAPDKLIYNESFSFVCFMFITPIIALVCIWKALYKNKQNIILSSVVLGTIIVMIIAAVMGKLVFITKYSIEVYPILIYLMAYGAIEFQKKYAGNILLSIFCLINLFYLVASPVSAPKMPRTEGHKLVADLINNANLKDGDVIITQYYNQERFGKYFDFDKYNVISMAKGNFYEYMSKEYGYADAYSKGKEIYKPIFAGDQNSYVEYQLQMDVLNKLKQNQSVLVLTNTSVAFYSNNEIVQIVNDEYWYKKVPIMFLIFSYLNNHTTDFLANSLTVTRVEQKGTWRIVKFTKVN